MLRQFFQFRREVDVLFVCTASVDEAWIRSTAIKCIKDGLIVGLAVCDRDVSSHRRFAQLYAGQRVRFFFGWPLRKAARIRCKAVVTASSGLTRDIFPTDSAVFVHMPHSLASLHMVYPEDAFDGYDYLFAAGPHHVAEFEAIAANRGFGNKGVVRIGYGKLDNFRSVEPRRIEDRHVLIAPSWGDGNLLEKCGLDLASALLKADWKVTIRPHPLFFLEKSPFIHHLLEMAKGREGLALESSLGGDDALLAAGVMIGDYSGTSFEFAAFRRRPVISVNVAPKVVNKNWQKLGIVPVEIGARSLLGPVLDPDVDQIVEVLESPLCGVNDRDVGEFLFDDQGSCADRAVAKLIELIT